METRKFSGVSSIRRNGKFTKRNFTDGRNFIIESNIIISEEEEKDIIHIVNKTLQYDVSSYGHIIARDILMLESMQRFSSVRVSANEKGSEWLIELSTNYREYE